MTHFEEATPRSFAETYYDKQLAPGLEALKTRREIPIFQFIGFSWESNHISVNMESLDALERFIMEARIILNRKAVDQSETITN